MDIEKLSTAELMIYLCHAEADVAWCTEGILHEGSIVDGEAIRERLENGKATIRRLQDECAHRRDDFADERVRRQRATQPAREPGKDWRLPDYLRDEWLAAFRCFGVIGCPCWDSLPDEVSCVAILHALGKGRYLPELHCNKHGEWEAAAKAKKETRRDGDPFPHRLHCGSYPHFLLAHVIVEMVVQCAEADFPEAMKAVRDVRDPQKGKEEEDRSADD